MSRRNLSMRLVYCRRVIPGSPPEMPLMKFTNASSIWQVSLIAAAHSGQGRLSSRNSRKLRHSADLRMGRSPGWHIDRCPASPQEGCVASPWANPKRRQLYHISGWATENVSREVFVSYPFGKYPLNKRKGKTSKNAIFPPRNGNKIYLKISTTGRCLWYNDGQ